jgi:hypothetical protein
VDSITAPVVLIPAEELATEAARCLLMPLLAAGSATNELRRVLGRAGLEPSTFGQLRIPIERARLVPGALEPLILALSHETVMRCIAEHQIQKTPYRRMTSSDEDFSAGVSELSESDIGLAAWLVFATGQTHSEVARSIFESILAEHCTEEFPADEIVQEDSAAYADSRDTGLLAEAIGAIANQLDRLTEVVDALATKVDALAKRSNGARPQSSEEAARPLAELARTVGRLEQTTGQIAEKLKTTSERTERTGQRVKKISSILDELGSRTASSTEMARVNDAIDGLHRLTIGVGQRIESIEDLVREAPDAVAAQTAASDAQTPGPTEALGMETPEQHGIDVAGVESAFDLDDVAALGLRAEEIEAAERNRFHRHEEAVIALSGFLVELMRDNPEWVYIDGHNTIVEPLKSGFKSGHERTGRDWLISTVAELMEITHLDRVWLAFDTRHENNTGSSDYPGLEVRFLKNGGVADGADQFITGEIRSRSPYVQGAVFTSDQSHIWPAVAAAREDGYNVNTIDATLLFTALRVLDEALSTSDLCRADARESLAHELQDCTPPQLHELELVGLLGFRDPAIRMFSQYLTRVRRTHRGPRPSSLFDDPALRSAARHIREGDLARAYALIDKAEFADSNSWDVRPLRTVANLVEGEWREAKRIALTIEGDSEQPGERRFEAACIIAVADSMSSTVAPDTSLPQTWRQAYGVKTYSYGLSVLRVLEEALLRADSLPRHIRQTLRAIRIAVVPSAESPLSEAQVELLRRAGVALQNGDWVHAEIHYQELHDSGIASRHKVLNLAMVAMGTRRYSDAQDHVREFRSLALTPTMQVHHACMRHLACAGAGDETDIDTVRDALRTAGSYVWLKAPVRHLVKGLLVGPDGDVRDAAREIDELMARMT